MSSKVADVRSNQLANGLVSVGKDSPLSETNPKQESEESILNNNKKSSGSLNPPADEPRSDDELQNGEPLTRDRLDLIDETNQQKPIKLLTNSKTSPKVGYKPAVQRNLSDDSSELSELEDSEAETERLDLDREPDSSMILLDDSKSFSSSSGNGISNRKRKLSDDLADRRKRRLTESEPPPPSPSLNIIDHDMNGLGQSEQQDEDDDKEEPQNPEPSVEETNGIVDKEINAGSDAKTKSNVEDEEEDDEIHEDRQQLQRKEAISLLTEIEIDFAKLRDQLLQDKMIRFITEIEMCADGTHPELSNAWKQIAQHRDEKIRLAIALRNYQRQRISNTTRASREQVHQQFLKDQAEIKSKLLLKTTEDWYKINRERRAMDVVTSEYTYQVSEDRYSQVLQRQAQNDEVSLLMGIHKNVGFPAMPELTSTTEEAIEHDLAEMGLRRPPPTQSNYPNGYSMYNNGHPYAPPYYHSGYSNYSYQESPHPPPQPSTKYNGGNYSGY